MAEYEYRVIGEADLDTIPIRRVGWEAPSRFDKLESAEDYLAEVKRTDRDAIDPRIEKRTVGPWQPTDGSGGPDAEPIRVDVVPAPDLPSPPMPSQDNKKVSKDLVEKATKARVEFYNGEGSWENGGFSERTKDEWRDQTRVMLEAVVPGLEEEWEARLLSNGGQLLTVSDEAFKELDRKWSRPVEACIKDGELWFRTVDPDAASKENR